MVDSFESTVLSPSSLSRFLARVLSPFTSGPSSDPLLGTLANWDLVGAELSDNLLEGANSDEFVGCQSRARKHILLNFEVNSTEDKHRIIHTILTGSL